MKKKKKNLKRDKNASFHKNFHNISTTNPK